MVYAADNVRQFGPNVVGFQLTTWERQWYIIGCYLSPGDTSAIESVIATLKDRLRGAELLVAVYLNRKLLEPEGYQKGEEIAAALTTAGLEYMLEHFLPRQFPWCQDGKTWIMVWAWR